MNKEWKPILTPPITSGVKIVGDETRVSDPDRIDALEAEVARLESVVDRLRGQLQNCVAHLERANRRQFKQEYSPAIESANRALYETLVEGGGR